MAHALLGWPRMRGYIFASAVVAVVAVGATAACDERTSSTSVTIVQTKPASAPAGSAATVDDRCARGEQHACGELLGDETRSHAAIADAITKLCDRGSLAACNSLGAAKLDGEIVPKDAAGAVALWEKSCAAKNGAGCNNVGVAHREGLVSEKDPAKALASFQQACELSSAAGCANAGRMLGDGAGVPQDVPAATKLPARPRTTTTCASAATAMRATRSRFFTRRAAASRRTRQPRARCISAVAISAPRRAATSTRSR